MTLWGTHENRCSMYLHQYELPVCSSSITHHPQAIILVGSEEELLELGHLGAGVKTIRPPVCKHRTVVWVPGITHHMENFYQHSYKNIHSHSQTLCGRNVFQNKTLTQSNRSISSHHLSSVLHHKDHFKVWQTGILLTILTAAVWLQVCGVDPLLNPEAQLPTQNLDGSGLSTARWPRQQ